jgi:hypothetical protein
MGAGGAFGGATEPGSARQEAERLVATVLAMVQSAASGARAGAFGPVGQLISDVLDRVTPERPTASEPAGDGPAAASTDSPTGTGSAGGAAPAGAGFATGTPECCVCPICRTINALRDPSPELVERLATGAGDFAAGLASLLRALSGVAGSGGGTPSDRTAGAAPTRPSADDGPVDRSTGPGREPGPAAPDADDGPPTRAHPRVTEDHVGPVWREATRTGHDSWPAAETDVWAAATRAEPNPAVSADLAEPERWSPGERTDRSGSGDSRAGVDDRRAAVPATRTPDGGVAADPTDEVASGGG